MAEDNAGNREDGLVTVVLTANNHLGSSSFGQQPRKREERQQRLRQAFQRATDFAIGQSVDLFIQTGDLFDTATPEERDRSFVATRLAQLKQAGIRTFALGGVHDTPLETQSLLGETSPAPQISYANLGALTYLPPRPKPGVNELEPLVINVHGTLVGICGLGILADQVGDPLSHIRPQSDLERAAIRILLLHAPVEGLSNGSTLLDTRALVGRNSIINQPLFRYILSGYQHGFSQTRIGHCDVIASGATQRIDFTDPDGTPGFVFMGLAADGIRWCNHITADTLSLKRLVIRTSDLWSGDEAIGEQSPTEIILERLRPLCNAETMVQLRLEGELTRRQYHQLNLNQIRRYGEEQSFALAIDDSSLTILATDTTLSGGESGSAEGGERFSPREELVALADEWIAAASDEQEKRALRATKEELLATLDGVKTKR